MFSKEHYNTVRKEFDGLAKPVGSLGKLENIAAQIAGITHSHSPTIDPAAIALFGADHGIAVDNSVTPWTQAITAKMLEVMGENKAAVSVLARTADVYVEIINVGAIVDSKSPNVRNERVASGTQDIRIASAMSETVVRAALEVGAATAERLIAGGSRCLVTGEVGIGNTTPSAALIAHFTKATAEQVTGRGSGIDDETYLRKKEIVANLIARVKNEKDACKKKDIIAKLKKENILDRVAFIDDGSYEMQDIFTTKMKVNTQYCIKLCVLDFSSAVLFGLLDSTSMLEVYLLFV
jgi:nicotinate-nucleotide--dimethylbenzimidazole phosphoribosyltransferase